MVMLDDKNGIVKVGVDTSLDELAHFLNDLYQEGKDYKILIVDELDENTDFEG